MLCVLLGTGCISTGETIRVAGMVVDTQGQPVIDATVLATAAKRGGTLTRPSEIVREDTEDEERDVSVTYLGDGGFVAEAKWAGRLTLAVEGYKIRRVDDLDTVFLVPSRSFFQSQDQVRLEVVKDE
jgi:hypothetical protein